MYRVDGVEDRQSIPAVVLGYAPNERLFTLVGRPDREVICAQSSDYRRRHPARTVRAVLCELAAAPSRLAKSSSEVGGVDVFPLPCAGDSRRARALAGLGVFAEVTGQADDVLRDEPADGAA